MTTQTVTEFTCDRCGHETKGYLRDESIVGLPFRWVSLVRTQSFGLAEVDNGGSRDDTMDLCPDCAESFEVWRVQSAVPA